MSKSPHVSPAADATPFACPRCGARLQGTTGLACAGCRIEFPCLDGVPWLFAEPQAALVEWRTRIDFALASLARDRTTVERSLAKGVPSPHARARLERLREGYAHQHAALRELLAPVWQPTFERAIEVHLALRTRLPVSQGLTSYVANLFRDWAWGDEENRASADLVETARAPAQKQSLVLGAGAGRLAYDLHRARPACCTFALDFNPLLVLAAERLARGGTLELVEFPIAPRAAANTCERHALRAPAAAGSSLRFVLADALRAPFAPASFDEIVTPWFIDIVEEDLGVLAARVNALLAPRGRWIVFGSLAFAHPDPSRCYSREEVSEQITAAGFAIAHDADATIPYMNAPGSRHARQERVVAIAADKVGEVAPPPRHEALPEWLVRRDRPVPALPAFRTQALTTRIYAFVMSLIDGKRSLAEMSALMAQQKLMPADEAEVAIRGFLTKMWDESRQPPR
jgi:ubiquinone/menaquinone biosynthesis C-methylase UbiE